MTPPRKQPSAGFWITVALVAVLVGYPLSFGPACRMLAPLGNPPWAMVACSRFYSPLFWISNHAPKRVQKIADWYCDF